MLQNQAIVSVRHDRTGDVFGPVRTKSGGGKTGESTTDRPGGMGPPEAFAGTYEFEPIEVTIGLKHERDSGLEQKANDYYGERFTITEQMTDAKARAGFHRPTGYTGILDASSVSEYDANGNERRTLSMTFAIDGVV